MISKYEQLDLDGFRISNMGLKMDDFQSQEAYTTEDSENISIFVADDNQEFRDFIVTT
ncbi:MAG: hypothetical protein GXY77_14065, partial [Fibrobacter sp.]|nr:hypothetical protein [Fibrobacter sp.]